MRMYLRWAERHGYPTKVIDTSYAEEAGLKSATFEVNAPYAFGNLSVEAGTHRLVRISPFDNQGRRQTSFAAVEVIPLIEQTDSIEIPESEIKVDVFRSSGPGGQSVNTTDSAVRMTHIPTGIVVSMQNEKSQIQNRAAALRVLQSRLLLVRQAEEDAKKKEMAGDIKASWGDQMRSYVLQPYQMVKDLRTEHEVGQHGRGVRRRHRRLHRGRASAGAARQSPPPTDPHATRPGIPAMPGLRRARPADVRAPGCPGAYFLGRPHGEAATSEHLAALARVSSDVRGVAGRGGEQRGAERGLLPGGTWFAQVGEPDAPRKRLLGLLGHGLTTESASDLVRHPTPPYVVARNIVRASEKRRVETSATGRRREREHDATKHDPGDGGCHGLRVAAGRMQQRRHAQR